VSRDFQRSRVYAWEKANGYFRDMDTISMEACQAYATKVFASERGRYGLAGRGAPEVRRGRGRSEASWHGHYIKLGTKGRRPATIVHEVAHCLTPGDQPGGAHGPRFVGVLIGLMARHLGADRDALVASAEEMGVKVNLTAIGATPTYGWSRRVLDALNANGGRAANEMEIAVWLQVSYRVVRGGILTLVRQGKVRRQGRQVVMLSCAPKA
jgi:hypothetical protein